jgi:hypothetical protein
MRDEFEVEPTIALLETSLNGKSRRRPMSANV